MRYLQLKKLSSAPVKDPQADEVRVYADEDGALRAVQSDGSDDPVGGEGGGGSNPLLTGHGAPVNGVNEFIEITGSPSSGTFTLTFRGDTTDPIAFDATTQEVVDALAALPSIDGDVQAAPPGSDVTLPGSGYIDFKFVGALGSQVVEVPALDDNTDGSLAIAEYEAGAEPTPSGARAGDFYLDLDPVRIGPIYYQRLYVYVDDYGPGPTWNLLTPADTLALARDGGGSAFLQMSGGGYDGSVLAADDSTLLASWYLDTIEDHPNTGTSYVWTGFDELGHQRFQIYSQAKGSGTNDQKLLISTARSDGSHAVVLQLDDDGIKATGLPTSPVGLPTGSLYIDTDTIKIVT